MCMSAKYVQVLNECRVALVKDLDPEDVMDYLIADGVFISDDQEKVKFEKTRKEKVRQLLEIILRRGDKAFDVLVKALEDCDSGHHHLYKLLVGKLAEVQHLGVPMQLEEEQHQNAVQVITPGKPIKCTEPNTSDSADACKASSSMPHQSQNSSYDYPETMRNDPKSPNMIPDDKLLSQLAGQLGQEWELLVTKLGLSPSDIYRFKMENQYNVWGQTYNALIKWRNRNYRNATINILVKELKGCNIARDRYEFLMNA